MLKSNFLKISACILAVMMLAPTGLFFTTANEPIVVVPAAEVVDDSVDTIVIQPNATDGKDAHLSSSAPNTNFGNNTAIATGTVPAARANGLIEFDIPPSIGSLKSATLSLYCTFNNNVPYGVKVSVYPINSPWIEWDTSWLDRSAGTLWDNQGGDYNSTIVSYINVSQTNTWYNWNVTNIVNLWSSGIITNNGLILNSSALGITDNFVRFLSSDYTADTNLTPKLTLTYFAEINPAVPAQAFNEDEAARTISLVGRDYGSVVHRSGATTLSDSYPFDGAANNSCHIQSIYTPEQIGAEGVIKRLSLERLSIPPDVGTFNDFVISMAHTSRTNVTSTFTTNFDGNLIEVFSEQNVVLNSSDGDSWLHFDLNDNFTYDESHNLLVDIQWNGDDGQTVLTGFTTGFSEPKTVYQQDAAPPIVTVNNLLVAKFTTDVVDNAIIDNGTVNNNWLFEVGQTYTKFQMLYNATDLGNQSGIIDSIGFYKTSIGTSSFPNVTISLAHTDNTSADLSTTFSHNYIGSLTQSYYRANHTFNASNRWFQFDLDNNFNYDGVHNLIVQVEWSGTPFGPSVFIERGDGTGTNWIWTYTSGSPTGTADSNYYNIQIIFRDSANLTWSATNLNPELFTATISGGPSLVITPIADAFGSGAITLTLINNGGGSVSQNVPVTINAVNDAPILSGPDLINCTEDIETQLNMTGYVTDIDSDIADMTYSVSSAFASVNGSAITFLYPEGIYWENVTITVRDLEGATASWISRVNITPVNDAPEFTSYVNTLTCDAEINKVYTVHPVDEETVTGQLTVYTNSAYATVSNHAITFLYPKGIGSESVTIFLVDEDMYGEQNNRSYNLAVTINDHPDVIAHSPNGTAVAVTSTIQVTFDMPMNTTNVENAFNFSKDSIGVNGTFAWGSNNTIMTFTPNEHLTNGLYDVRVAATAASAKGISMFNSYSWNFTAALGSFDGDSDGMPDQYELDNGLNPDANDATADLDGDGMPNLYEYQNDLDPAVNDAGADADGDGATNLEEYEANTDPNDQNDKPSEPMSMGLLFIIVIIVVVVIMLFVLKGRGSKAPPEQQPQQDWGQQEQDQQWDEPQEDAPVEEQYQEPEYTEPEPQATEPAEPAEPAPDAEQPPPPQDDGDISHLITEE